MKLFPPLVNFFKKSVFFFLKITLLLYSCSVISQVDILNQKLKIAAKDYKKGDFANSILNYEDALALSLNLNDNIQNKDSLFLLSLKQLITVSGISKAMGVAEKYFKQYKSEILQNVCNHKNQAISIGIINNYVGVASYNDKPQEAINAFEMFKLKVDNCKNFRSVDIVQSAANAVMAYSKVKQINKAVSLLPLIGYYKDSLPNWSKADYDKVMGFFYSKTNDNKELVINSYLKSAKEYSANKRFDYALNLYENLLNNYDKHLSNEELREIIKKSKLARDSTEFYHNDLYKSTMNVFGQIMIERTNTEEENLKLKNNFTYIVIVLLIVAISFLAYHYKQVLKLKNYYKKLYTLENRVEAQNEKLQKLKSKFIQNNYNLEEIKANKISLFETLKKDFPNLKYNIYQNFTNITTKEEQIIYCTLLNLTTKESADLLSMTHGSYRVAKSRLIKKTAAKNTQEFSKLLKNLI